MRRVLLISALVVSLVALTAVMPSSSTAFFGRWGVGYGGYPGYAGYGGCGLGYGGYVGYGGYPGYVGYRGYGAGYYGRYYRGPRTVRAQKLPYSPPCGLSCKPLWKAAVMILSGRAAIPRV